MKELVRILSGEPALSIASVIGALAIVAVVALLIFGPFLTSPRPTHPRTRGVGCVDFGCPCLGRRWRPEDELLRHYWRNFSTGALWTYRETGPGVFQPIRIDGRQAGECDS